ncbi:colicin import membrane protein [Janthinobacterium sp. CG_23.3]|uniref:cell envelope integrity protein TolA n=1 Tax=Janthinobacterium sp. CG_23.3 TaxID=3349634 RepID=UPI0038D4536A
MNPAHADEAPYRVPRDKRRWPALALAVGVHAGLLFFLWIGVSWQNTEPVAVEAEVWDVRSQAAAPPAPAPEPTPPPPRARPEPAPPPRPAPKVAPPPVEAPPVPQAPDIALEKRKEKRKAEKDKLAELAKLKEQRKLDEQEKAEKAAEKAEKIAKAEKAEKAEKVEKAEKAAKLAKEKNIAKEKALAEQDAAEQKEAADKKLADKLAKSKRAAAEQKAADAVRNLEMSRITGAVGAGTSGTAAKSTAPRSDSGYAAAITAKIKSNIAYSGNTDVPGNPRAVFKIDQLPTGEIISVRKVKSSGIPAYDSAVENAITKSSPLPKKKDGTVEREVDAGFNMKDLP